MITLTMDIPEAERKIEIRAATISAAIVELLQLIQGEFSTINPDILRACADLMHENEFEGIEFPKTSFHDMSCPEDNFTLEVNP